MPVKKGIILTSATAEGKDEVPLSNICLKNK
jgi:hypothetical protein